LTVELTVKLDELLFRLNGFKKIECVELEHRIVLLLLGLDTWLQLLIVDLNTGI